jgi:hypothetical protein
MVKHRSAGMRIGPLIALYCAWLTVACAKETAKSYGVLRSALGLMEIASRETFIIDPGGS